MKKIIFSIFLSAFLFGDSLKFYFFSMKENYKEYEGGRVIDRDYSGFNDITGIGITYTNRYMYGRIILNGEFAGGDTVYNGSTQSGIPVKYNQTGMKLYNLSAAIESRAYFLKLGYRFWRRGSSNDPGNYNEDYYWSYISSGLHYFINSSKITFDTIFQYQYAINPKIKIYLGNNPTLNLGDTSGLMAKIDLGYKYSYNLKIGIFYKYDYWQINASNYGVLILNNQKYVIYEPDSETRNQYLGVYIQKSF